MVWFPNGIKAPGSKSEPLKPAVDPSEEKPQCSGGGGVGGVDEWKSLPHLCFPDFEAKYNRNVNGNVAVHDHGHPGWRGTLNAAVSFSSSHWLMSQNGLFSFLNDIVFRALKWRKWPMTFEKLLCTVWTECKWMCVCVQDRDTETEIWSLGGQTGHQSIFSWLQTD